MWYHTKIFRVCSFQSPQVVQPRSCSATCTCAPFLTVTACCPACARHILVSTKILNCQQGALTSCRAQDGLAWFEGAHHVCGRRCNSQNNSEAFQMSFSVDPWWRTHLNHRRVGCWQSVHDWPACLTTTHDAGVGASVASGSVFMIFDVPARNRVRDLLHLCSRSTAKSKASCNAGHVGSEATRCSRAKATGSLDHRLHRLQNAFAQLFE